MKDMKIRRENLEWYKNQPVETQLELCSVIMLK